MSLRKSGRLTLIGFACIALVAAVAVSGPAHPTTRGVVRHFNPHGSAIAFGRVGGGEAERRGSGPAQEQYENRAYPRAYVSHERVLGALNAYHAILRGKALAPAVGSSWQEIGPSTLKVPAAVTYAGGNFTVSGRVTALAIANTCVPTNCRVWVGTAGGGVWRTNDGLANPATWAVKNTGLDTNAIGSLLLDPNDGTGNTIYAGTGEQNGSGDSEAGLGLYMSTDGGNTWSVVAGSVAVAKDRSVASIAVDPTDASHIYIGTAVARHGSSSVNGGRRTPPGAPTLGLYESTNGGTSFSLIFSQAPNPNPPSGGSDWFQGGVNWLGFDPNDANSLYVSVIGYGLWRQSPTEDGDGAFHHIFGTYNPADTFGDNTGFALADLGGGGTRIYVADSSDDLGYSVLWRSDDVHVPAGSLYDGASNVGYTLLSDPTPGTPGFASYGFCGAQCGYDLLLGTPNGHPDQVWIGGYMQYDQIHRRSNGQAVQRSQDAGASFTDMTEDVQTPPGGLHPDHRSIVFSSSNPNIAFMGSDGGVVRTSGKFGNRSSDCDTRGLNAPDLANCHAWLSKVPTRLISLNKGLRTIQFQSLSANPSDPLHDLMGGTQDNGTESYTGSSTWVESVGGDGGQSGYNISNPDIRFHTYYEASPDINFSGADPNGWDWIGDPVFETEAQSFYIPIIPDPATAGTIFLGEQHVWRTLDNGGNQATLDAHCNEYTGDFPPGVTCGDWVKIGGNGPTGDVTSTQYGADRAGQYIVALARTTSDLGTLWVGTRIGRVLVSFNANASPVAVNYTRIDTPSTPGRFVSGIEIDPFDSTHAYVSYSGYDTYTPGQSGHVFDVHYNPGTGTATWTDISYNLGDQPVTGIARDDLTGDLYVSSDFTVYRLPSGGGAWSVAAAGLPLTATFGLTIDPGARVLYAATHGRGAWRLKLPAA